MRTHGHAGEDSGEPVHMAGRPEPHGAGSSAARADQKELVMSEDRAVNPLHRIDPAVGMLDADTRLMHDWAEQL